MVIKLIALDLDGTVLRTDKTISERNLKAIRSAVSRGIIVLPATGRMVKMVPDLFSPREGIRYAITSNGASVLDLRDGTILYSNLMTMEQSNRILRMLSSYGLLIEAYCDGASYANREALDALSDFNLPRPYYDLVMASQIFVEDLPGFIERRNRPLEKINLPYVPEEFREELEDRLECMEEYRITSSCLSNIEINAAAASKGTGLGHLCKRLSISPSQVMAVGDGSNDISLLEYAGCSVAMGNASEPAKRAAKFVTRGNDDDGVAYAVEKFALSYLY